MAIFNRRKFWIDTAERAVKTVAQSAVLALGSEQVLDAISLNYREVVGIALGGGLLSLLTSIASAGVGEEGTASAV